MDVSGADVTVSNGGLFTFNEGATVGGLNGVAGAITDANGTTQRSITLGGANTYSYAGNLTNSGSGTLSLTVRMNYGGGKGVQTFSGNSTLKGGTEIAAGTLILVSEAMTYTGTNGGMTYTFTLDNGILAVVPEPAAWLLLSFAGTFFIALRRRRRLP
ncbi:MAG: PEP-CTERM sorting domain-containing protein [Verrucomicrobiae bacterium]